MIRSAWFRSGVLLGVALGGFFDGILLHQILQWHHLLSNVAGMTDLRVQVLWDGYFHALMYLVALAAVWGLWRSRATAEAPAPRGLAAALLVGFGAWHIADITLSHWILQIHNIRLDNPLAWDLLFFAVFGIIPLLLGLRLSRQTKGGGLEGPTLAVILLAFVTAGAGLWNLRPPANQKFTAVLFRPDYDAFQILDAVAAVDPEARIVWSNLRSGIVVVTTAPERSWNFYRHGALLVGGAGTPAGCLTWSRA